MTQRLQETPLAFWTEPAAHPDSTCVKQNPVRTVWKIRWAGMTCYAKYYRHGGWREQVRNLFRPPACEAELHAGRFVQQADIAAARPLLAVSGLLLDGVPHALLVSAAIENARPLNEAWSEAVAAGEEADVREGLADLIAHAHQAGFEHLDMHAGNILLQRTSAGPRLYFVDLQTAHLDRPVDDRAVVRNLAQLNQWFRRQTGVRTRLHFLRSYLRLRNHYEPRCSHGRLLQLSFPQLVQALRRQADVHAERLWQQRDRRLARKGRYYAPLKLVSGWRTRVVRGWKHPRATSDLSQRTFDLDWWQEVLDPAALCAAAADGNLKQSHSAEVARTELLHPEGAVPVVLKHPRARNWRRRLRHMLHPSRVMRNWATGHQLLHRELPAAAPLAVLEQRSGPFVRDSLLLTEYVPGSEDLPQHLEVARAERSARAWCRYRQRFARTLALHLRNLHERGYRHRDCKADNILVRPGRDPQLLWIDLDGIQRVHPLQLVPARRRHVLQALARLYVSLSDHPSLTRTDYARMLRAYCTAFGVDRRTWRTMWRDVTEKVTAGETRRATRRAWKETNYGRA